MLDDDSCFRFTCRLLSHPLVYTYMNRNWGTLVHIPRKKRVSFLLRLTLHTDLMLIAFVITMAPYNKLETSNLERSQGKS
jgi:hypothetical protein